MLFYAGIPAAPASLCRKGITIYFLPGTWTPAVQVHTMQTPAQSIFRFQQKSILSCLSQTSYGNLHACVNFLLNLDWA